MSVLQDKQCIDCKEIKTLSDFELRQVFRDCWALSNLRPYSAKQNQLDGATKLRHKKGK